MVAAPGLVDKDEFLTRLPEVFESTKTVGTVWLTHKRLTYEGGDKLMTSSSDERDYACILRVTDGKKFKMSTQIQASELPAFHAAYGTLLKTSMTTLKKRDKKKERARLEKAELRRQRLAQNVKITAPKRAAGRRKFQRQMKAAIKQVSAREQQTERDEARAKKQLASATAK